MGAVENEHLLPPDEGHAGTLSLLTLSTQSHQQGFNIRPTDRAEHWPMVDGGKSLGMLCLHGIDGTGKWY